MRNRTQSFSNPALLAGLTLIAFSILGYHPGLEDDSFYLAAIKRNLNPALFPHDAEFFRVQFQATIFDKLIAWSVRLTHLPLMWAVMLWQLAAIFFLLHGCWRISRRCFARRESQWAATAFVAVLLSMPLPGIALNLADQYLHPRTLATAAILAAVVAVLDSRTENRRLWLAGLFLAIAFSIHAIMACFGISFCAFLYWTLHRRSGSQSVVPAAALLSFPLGWLFEPSSDAWRQAASTRDFYFLSRWHWYEWLGVFAPLLLLAAFRRVAARDRSPDTQATNSVLLPFLSALIYYGVFQTILGIALMLPNSLSRVRPLEPMRYLHLLYLLFLLIAGGLLGRYVLDKRLYRWMSIFIVLAAGMFYTQRELYPASTHLELPFIAPQNRWLQAFAWISRDTPVDALFAIDPHYMTLPAEDYHGFRALAERSVLADYEKDAGMAARVPGLAPRWLKEVTALNGWRTFQSADFARLKKEFGVTWILLSPADTMYASPDQNIMTCPYDHQQIKVCRLY